MNPAQIKENCKQGWNRLGRNEKIACITVSLIYAAGTVGICLELYNEIAIGDWQMGGIFAAASALAVLVNLLVPVGVESVGREARVRDDQPLSG